MAGNQIFNALQELHLSVDQIAAERDALNAEVERVREQLQGSEDKHQALCKELMEMVSNLESQQQESEVCDQISAGTREQQKQRH